jgi:hypothetical protein
MSTMNLSTRIGAATAASLMALSIAGCGERNDTTAAKSTAPVAAPGYTPAAAGSGAGGNVASAAVMSRDAGSDPDLLKALPASKHTLIEAIQTIEKAGEAPTAAKFEYEDGALHLAVYSSAKGTKTDAEHNVLKEHKGDPVQAAWAPKVETFGDVEHVSRAAEYHTLMELSPHSVLDIATKAQAEGVPLWVIPYVAGGQPVFEVGVLKGGQVSRLQYGLMDGERR